MRFWSCAFNAFNTVLCVAVLWSSAASAQDVEGNPWFLRAGVNPAYILPSNPFLAKLDTAIDPVKWAPNVTLEIGRHTDGREPWHELYGMPSIGFGLSFVSTGNAVTTGRPLEAYTFFSWPFARLGDRLALTTDFGMGLSWRWRQRNEQTGTYENVLGSQLDARIDWGFYARYVSTPRTSLYAGVDFTHRSNGGMIQPNLGINVIGPKVAVEYNLSEETRHADRVAPPAPFQPSWEFVVGGAGGVKNVIERENPIVRADFGAFDVTAAVQRHFYRYGKVAGGADLTYDGSTGASLDGADQEWRAAAGQRWGLGLYGGYEHVVGRFGAIVQAGTAVARGFATSDSSRLYSRFGWRYHINDRFWSTLAIRAHGFRDANALEFGVGYRIERRAGSSR